MNDNRRSPASIKHLFQNPTNKLFVSSIFRFISVFSNLPRKNFYPFREFPFGRLAQAEDGKCRSKVNSFLLISNFRTISPHLTPTKEMVPEMNNIFCVEYFPLPQKMSSFASGGKQQQIHHNSTSISFVSAIKSETKFKLSEL